MYSKHTSALTRGAKKQFVRNGKQFCWKMEYPGNGDPLSRPESENLHLANHQKRLLNWYKVNSKINPAYVSLIKPRLAPRLP